MGGLKRPGFEADRLTPSSAEVKNDWSCTFNLDIFVDAVCSKHVTVLCYGDGLCSAPADAKYNRVSQQDEREGKSVPDLLLPTLRSRLDSTVLHLMHFCGKMSNFFGLTTNHNFCHLK